MPPAMYKKNTNFYPWKEMHGGKVIYILIAPIWIFDIYWLGKNP